MLAKNIPFEVVNINLKKKPEWFLETTWGQVSVVRYKNQFIMESLINSDFIDEAFPEIPLHPQDPLDKAQGRLRVEKYGKLVGNIRLKISRPKKIGGVTLPGLRAWWSAWAPRQAALNTMALVKNNIN